MPALVEAPRRASVEETDAPMDDALSVNETAERFDVSVKTIYRQLWAGTFPCRAIQIGRVWRISRADVDRHLAELGGDR